MLVMTRIEDASAFVRLPKGIYKQVDVYHRGERVFVPHSGGFLRICAKFGDTFTTSHPDIKVLEISEGVPGLLLTTGEPRFKEDA